MSLNLNDFLFFFSYLNSFCLIRSRRYGVIECDPLVQKGLEKTVSDLLSSTGCLYLNSGPHFFK